MWGWCGRDRVREMKSVHSSNRSVDGHLGINVGKLRACSTPSYPFILAGSALVSGTPVAKVGWTCSSQSTPWSVA